MKCPHCLRECGAVFATGRIVEGFEIYACRLCAGAHKTNDILKQLKWLPHTGGELTYRKGAGKMTTFWFGKDCQHQHCQFEGSAYVDGPDWPKGLTPSLIHCGHKDNPLDHEGNCGPEICPLPVVDQLKWLPWPEGWPVQPEPVDGTVEAAPIDDAVWDKLCKPVDTPVSHVRFDGKPELKLLYAHWFDNPPERFEGKPWKLMTDDYYKFWTACAAVAFWRGFDLLKRGKIQDYGIEHAAWQAGRDWRRYLVSKTHRLPTLAERRNEHPLTHWVCFDCKVASFHGQPCRKCGWKPWEDPRR